MLRENLRTTVGILEGVHHELAAIIGVLAGEVDSVVRQAAHRQCLLDSIGDQVLVFWLQPPDEDAGAIQLIPHAGDTQAAA
ncbi:MAG: hypothetical protein R3F14_33935 [Polyangiaceae bacterium]